MTMVSERNRFSASMADETRLKTMEESLRRTEAQMLEIQEFMDSTRSFMNETKARHNEICKWQDNSMKQAKNQTRQAKNQTRLIENLTEMVRALLAKDQASTTQIIPLEVSYYESCESGNSKLSDSSLEIKLSFDANYEIQDRNFGGCRPEMVQDLGGRVESCEVELSRESMVEDDDCELSPQFTQDSVAVRNTTISTEPSPTPAILDMDSNLVIEEMHHDVIFYNSPAEVHRSSWISKCRRGNDQIPEIAMVAVDVRLKWDVDGRRDSIESLDFMNAYKVFAGMSSRKNGNETIIGVFLSTDVPSSFVFDPGKSLKFGYSVAKVVDYPAYCCPIFTLKSVGCCGVLCSTVLLLPNLQLWSHIEPLLVFDPGGLLVHVIEFLLILCWRFVLVLLNCKLGVLAMLLMQMWCCTLGHCGVVLLL